MTADYNLYEERPVDETPIFWATLKEQTPPMVWLLLEREIDSRFAKAIEAISAST